MRGLLLFVAGLVCGLAVQTTMAQNDTSGVILNHVGLSVPSIPDAAAFYTQKMGFREAFTVKGADGKPTLAYVQASRNTFVELQQANANRRPGLNHFGLHVENLKATVATLKARGVMVEEPRVRPDDSSVANATASRTCATA